MIQLMYKVPSGTIDISEFTEKINWKGSIKQSVRVLEMTIFMPQDNVIPFEIGGALSFFYEEKLLFKGQLFSISESRETSRYHLVFYDAAVALNNRKITLKVKNVSSETIIREMCKKLDMPIGNLPKIKARQEIVAVNKTGRDIIDYIYGNSKEKNKHEVLAMYYDDALNILPIGEELLPIQIIEGENLVAAQYSMNGDSIINSVKVVSDEGHELSTIEDKVSIEKIGRFQHVLVARSIDYVKEANRWLSKPIESLEATVLGNPYFLSGYKVCVYDQSRSYQQEYVIESERHEFNEKGYMTYMSLRYKEAL